MTETHRGEKKKHRGPLAWMAKNSVAANVLMILLLVGGAISVSTIKQEVFPEFDLDLILINVPYPGASPSEVEKGVSQAVEEAVRGIDGVKEVRSTNSEGFSIVAIELLLGTDADVALNDVKAAVDRITSFPEDVERPTIFRASNRFEVISLVIYGDLEPKVEGVVLTAGEDAARSLRIEKSLRALAEEARDGLLADDRITSVELFGVRPLEVSVEVPAENLRRYGITLDQIAGVIRQSSLEIPGGGVKTAGGEVKLTTTNRPSGEQFGAITLLSGPDGTEVKIADVATVNDAFAETDQAATFNGKPAVMIRVFRTGAQTPLDISAAVKQYVADNTHRLPPNVEIATWMDTSEFYAQRIDLLMKNAVIGLILVLIVLGLFLEVKLAFWVTLGIPISFVGSFLLLPSMDVSINMISLFAFILVLGMVVDDAIIVGEEIYSRRQQGMGRIEAAITGVKAVAMPVIFAILTTVIFYAPLLFVPGVAGKFFRVIPVVVIATLIMSLIESLVILPAHLAKGKKRKGRSYLFGWAEWLQERVSGGLEKLIAKMYVPTVRWATRNRYLTMALAFAMLISSCGMIAGGRIKTIFMPKVEGDMVQAVATLPFGSSIDQTRAVQDKMIVASREILTEAGGEEKVSRGIFAQVGGSTLQGGPGGVSRNTGTHLTEVAVFMVEADKRAISAGDFANKWREKMANVAGLEKLVFHYSTGPSGGAAVRVDLRHKDMGVLAAAANELAGKVREYKGTFDVDDGFEQGKEQLEYELTAAGRSLGLTKFELGRQIRSSYFGAEALRQQRGRDEVRVYVRLPRSERESEYNLENLQIRTPSGGDIPLREAATLKRGRAYTQILRVNGFRTVSVTGDVELAVGNPSEISEGLVKDYLPGLVERYPGLSWELGGEQKEMKEMNAALILGMLMALVAALGVLAVAFRSYMQPIIVVLAIPFGFVGALWGHVLLGFDLSMMSWMGIVALAGVVVNDSLILVVGVNEFRAKGLPVREAVVEGGARRFRPILLTSLTTFFGLAPMILETSVQARFLVPMAVSLGFGVLFATFITLLLVPSAYLIVDDIKRGISRFIRAFKQGASDVPGTGQGDETDDVIPRAVATDRENDSADDQ